ncbi:MATH and LRR domain-containing protein PFE0570w-like [Melitaea cinxia]|uniref:MATH and LRR domain-containing protein PFE0570w-like n=1 Tax=Melitaea cinxia TaxID=113334 RepID=UPI001E26F6FB|nr:MATH and LRR domain-containing protein PFE0570w-like [Melitaea cinxia]
MDNKSRSSSNISLDSLEFDVKRELLKQKSIEDNVDTILVPLYERDVLIKVPKRKKKQNQGDDKCMKQNCKSQKEVNEVANYLVNKDSRRTRRTSYLDIFRKQFTSNCTETQNKINNNEIRSLSPEFGDTERESIGNESYNHSNDFYNTESYNEIYYDKLMKQELQQYLEQSFDEVLNLEEDVSKFPDSVNDNNLRSVSEVSAPRRRLKTKIISPIQNVHLGGLGADMETIKPRLERARSLQRYSEKVRMENRLRIYKKEVRDEKPEREASTTRRLPTTKNTKSAKDPYMKETAGDRSSKLKPNSKVKKSTTDSKHNEEASPLQINFMVNVSGVRPSTALRSLEEKHRMYQEKVKQYTTSVNNI